MPEKKRRILLSDFRNADISSEIPYLFKRAGCDISLYCAKRSWLRKSRYYDAWHPASDTDPAAYAQGLAELVRSGDYAWVVLLDDYALRAAHDHLSDEDAQKILPVRNLAHRGLAGSKIALSHCAVQHRLPTPRFAVCQASDHVARAAAKVGYPLLIKEDRSGGGKGISYCADEAALVAKIAAIPASKRPSLLLQAYISGDNISVEALYRKGVLVAYSYARVIENMESEFGVSTVRSYEAAGSFEKDLLRTGEALGIDGFCSFTFMRDRESGIHYLVEADLRPHSWFALARFCGVDFSEGIRRYLSNESGLLRQEGPAVEIRHFSRDFIAAIKNRDGKKLFGWLGNADGRWRFIPFHDVRLFGATMTMSIGHYLFKYVFLLPNIRRIKRGARAAGRFLRTNVSRLYPEYDPLWNYFSYYEPEWKRIALSLVCSLAQMSALVPIPFITKGIFDAALPHHDIGLLIGSISLIAFLFAANSLLLLANRHIILSASKSIVSAMRAQLVARTLALGQAFYAHEDLDTLHSRIVHDTERLDRVTNSILAQMLPAFLIVGSLAAILVYLNPLLFVVMAVVLPLLYAGSKVVEKKVREGVRQFHADFAGFSRGVSFMLKFNELIAFSGAESLELARQEERVRSLEQSSKRMAWLSTVYGVIQNNLLALGGVLALLVGGTQIMHGGTTLGGLLSFYVALNLLGTNARTLLSGVPILIEGNESLKALALLLAENPAAAPVLKCAMRDLAYPIAFENVSFTYGTSFALRSASFSIEERSIVGIFGPSGSGKSTLIRLLLGLYEPSSGSISVGGEDMRGIDLAAYRASIGVLPQDPLLFPGTIRENLLYGIPDTSEEGMIRYAKLCRIHDFIVGLEKGYDSDIGSQSVNISGGQRQRIAIARALLRNPRLIILDEPDNNLDDRLVLEIMENIRALGITVVMISHDKALRSFVDNAILVDQGRVRIEAKSSASRPIRAPREDWPLHTFISSSP